VGVAGRDVGLSMVENGQAWAYRAYLPPECRLPRPGTELASTGILEASRGMCPILDAERDAREHGRGFWKLQADQRIPPWEWRHGH
jgi:endonuclease YncB( thermonuclease family)